MILLYNADTTDSILTTPGRIWNEAHPPRRYQAQGHYLVLEGPGHIISYDAEEICKIPGWRLASAQEQNAFTALSRQATNLEEARPPLPALPEVPAAPEEPPLLAEEAPIPPAASPPPVMTTATAPKSAGGKG